MTRALTDGALFVVGRGLWSPGYPTLASWLAGQRDDRVAEPACALVPSRARRGTSILTRSAVDAAGQAIADASLDASDVALVFGSAHGEMQIAIDQMDMMREGDGVISPARFKNSVHNTAAGLLSIATKNRGFATAIAAGDETVATSLLEAWMVVQDGDCSAVLVVADEALPPPLDAMLPWPSLAAALALTPLQPDARAHAVLRGLRIDPSAPPAAPSPRAAAFGRSPAVPILPLIEAIEGRRRGTIRLTPEGSVPYCVDLDFP